MHVYWNTGSLHAVEQVNKHMVDLHSANSTYL